jgi:hypothetical protein
MGDAIQTRLLVTKQTVGEKLVERVIDDIDESRVAEPFDLSL